MPSVPKLATLIWLALCLTGCNRQARVEVLPSLTEASPSAAVTQSVTLTVPSLQPATTSLFPTGQPTAPQAGPALIQAASGEIAFVSDRDGYPAIYTVNVDATGLAPLVDDLAGIMDPVWSPDGTQMAFTAYAPDGLDLSFYTVQADGSERQEIRQGPQECKATLGQGLVAGWRQRYVTRVGDLHPERRWQRVGPGHAGSLHADFPAWCRTGCAWLTSLTGRMGRGDVFVADADGSNPINLTQDEGNR
jgi:hypothetical protein